MSSGHLANSGGGHQQMTIVIVGHVDHGKSTVIGRLLADTGSLPEGKLEQVKALCARNSKPFEYAFLLDALKDEQSQGITIDAARCFFKTPRRHYMVFDAPGHIEFLKNMVSGAAHAEAALLVIDAKEGIQENSRRHGYLLAMLGVKQVAVIVNKMDLAGYSQAVFENIRREYGAFLASQRVAPASFIPIAALHGANIAARAPEMSWYTGPTVLEQLDLFENRKSLRDLPFRFPVQDIYKFTEDGDERRIAAGTVDSGTINAGEDVIFLPSHKRAVIKTVERFSAPECPQAFAGEAVGFTFTTQLYIKPGELMVRVKDRQPEVSTRFRANIFWMGHAPLSRGKTYKLKLASARAQARLVEITHVLDAAELRQTTAKQQVERHDVAEVLIETVKPVAFDLVQTNEGTGRFVLVDNYEIVGGGIILEALGDEQSLFKDAIREREAFWYRGSVTPDERSTRLKHRSKFVVIAGAANTGKKNIADELERRLWAAGCQAYYLGLSNMVRGLGQDTSSAGVEDNVRRLGELARIMTDAGLIFITTVSDVEDHDIEKLKRLNEPSEIVVVSVGEPVFGRFTPDVQLAANADKGASAERIIAVLKRQNIVEADYSI
jgi:bifunctional enzyme CysN/CysC